MNDLSLHVRDGAGLLDAQSYTIDVRNNNLAPQIASIARSVSKFSVGTTT